MNVRELISILQSMDQESRVCMVDYCYVQGVTENKSEGIVFITDLLEDEECDCECEECECEAERTQKEYDEASLRG